MTAPKKRVKLSTKLAGVFATGAFLMVSLLTYFGSVDPVEFMKTLLYQDGVNTLVDTSLSKPIKVLTLRGFGAIVAGMLGYFLGEIFAHPKGRRERREKDPVDTEALGDEALEMTGDEMFLDDLEMEPSDPDVELPPPQPEDAPGEKF